MSEACGVLLPKTNTLAYVVWQLSLLRDAQCEHVCMVLSEISRQFFLNTYFCFNFFMFFVYFLAKIKKIKKLHYSNNSKKVAQKVAQEN